MYSFLLALHSLVRWLVLISLVIAIFNALWAWKQARPFQKKDNLLRIVTLSIAHTQATLGLILYVISPIVQYFYQNFGTAIHLRQIRFFGMEHITVMLSAVVVITIGAVKSKKQHNDTARFKTLAIWFGIALLLILSSIPWAFSPLISRPWIRAF
jgi:hypothetical protein